MDAFIMYQDNWNDSESKDSLTLFCNIICLTAI